MYIKSWTCTICLGVNLYLYNIREVQRCTSA